MNIETIIATLTNAGFQVDTLDGLVVVQLSNRAVNTMEVVAALAQYHLIDFSLALLNGSPFSPDEIVAVIEIAGANGKIQIMCD